MESISSTTPSVFSWLRAAMTVIQTVVVEKEVIVEVEKPTIVEVEKEVVKEVQVVVTATPEAMEDDAMMMMPEGPWGILDIGLPVLGRYGSHPHEVKSDKQVIWGASASENLTTLEGSVDFSPRLAKSWSVSDDGSTWTFNLEEGVQFHKGRGEMTADDVIFSMAEHWREGTINDFAAQVQRTWGAEGGSVLAEGDHIVHVNTGTFQFDMLEVTSQTLQWIFSKKAVEDLGQEAASVEGAMTGPFEFVEQGPGFWRFRAVEDH